MGQGTVTNAIDSTNRDINNTQEITRDQVTGMLDGSVTVDHRLLSESGRAEIIQEQKDLAEDIKSVATDLLALGVNTAVKLGTGVDVQKIKVTLGEYINDEQIQKDKKELVNTLKTLKSFKRSDLTDEQKELLLDMMKKHKNLYQDLINFLN